MNELQSNSLFSNESIDESIITDNLNRSDNTSFDLILKASRGFRLIVV